MESLFSEWFEFHKWLLTGGCGIFDFSDANFTIDFLIFAIGGGSFLAIKRFIKGEKVVTRRGETGWWQ